MGAAGPGVYRADYLLPPNDRYYTLLECATCPAPDSATFQDVHVALDVAHPCDQPVEISVVAVMGDSACRSPDTLASLMAPEVFTLAGVVSGPHEFTLHLSKSVRFLGQAFLCVNFTSFGDSCAGNGSRPELITEALCTNCSSWNISVAGTQELCAVLLPGLPVMYATGGSCAVPVRAASWGALRMRYR